MGSLSDVYLKPKIILDVEENWMDYHSGIVCEFRRLLNAVYSTWPQLTVRTRDYIAEKLQTVAYVLSWGQTSLSSPVVVGALARELSAALVAVMLDSAPALCVGLCFHATSLTDLQLGIAHSGMISKLGALLGATIPDSISLADVVAQTIGLSTAQLGTAQAAVFPVTYRCKPDTVEMDVLADQSAVSAIISDISQGVGRFQLQKVTAEGLTIDVLGTSDVSATLRELLCWDPANSYAPWINTKLHLSSFLPQEISLLLVSQAVEYAAGNGLIRQGDLSGEFASRATALCLRALPNLVLNRMKSSTVLFQG